MSIGLGLALLVVGLLAFGFFRAKKQLNQPASSKITYLTDSNFQETIKTGITLVDCWADWCQPCKMLNPIINDLAEEYGEVATIGKLNVDQNRQVSAQYGIRSIPTLLIFKEGKEVNRIVGVKPKGFIVNELKKVGMKA